MRVFRLWLATLLGLSAGTWLYYNLCLSNRSIGLHTVGHSYQSVNSKQQPGQSGSSNAPAPESNTGQAEASESAAIPVLPKGWPLPSVTLPDDCTAARLNPRGCPGGPDTDGGYPFSVSAVPVNSGSPESARIYCLGLKCPGGFDQLDTHVKAEATKLNYSEHWTGREEDGSCGCEYIAPDAMFILQVYYWADTGDCHLAVVEYDHAQASSPRSLS